MDVDFGAFASALRLDPEQQSAGGVSAENQSCQRFSTWNHHRPRSYSVAFGSQEGERIFDHRSAASAHGEI